MLGYEEFVDCSDENFIKTFDDLQDIVNSLTREGVFSPNEQFKELDTNNLPLLLCPYYMAKVAGRIMENRLNRIQVSQRFFFEYLRMMKHYELLEDN